MSVLDSRSPVGAAMIGSKRWMKFHRHVVEGAVDHCMSQNGIADADRATMKTIILHNLKNGVVNLRPDQSPRFNKQCRSVWVALHNVLGYVLGQGNDDPPHAVDEYIQHVEGVCKKKGRSKEFTKNLVEEHTSFQCLLQVAKGQISTDDFDSVIEDEGGVDAEPAPAEPSASPEFPTPCVVMPLHTVASGAPHATVHMAPGRERIERPGVVIKPSYQPKNPLLHDDSAGPSNRAHPSAIFRPQVQLPLGQGTSSQHNPEVGYKESLAAPTKKHPETGNAKPPEPKRPTLRRSGPKTFKLPTAVPTTKDKLSGPVPKQIAPPKRSTTFEVPIKSGQPSQVPTSPAVKKRSTCSSSHYFEPKRIRIEEEVAITPESYEEQNRGPGATVQAGPEPAGNEVTPLEQAVPLQAEDELQKLRANCGAMQRFIGNHNVHAEFVNFLVPYMLSDCGAAAKKLAEAMKAYIQQSAYHADFVG